MDAGEISFADLAAAATGVSQSLKATSHFGVLQQENYYNFNKLLHCKFKRNKQILAVNLF